MASLFLVVEEGGGVRNFNIVIKFFYTYRGIVAHVYLCPFSSFKRVDMMRIQYSPCWAVGRERFLGE